LAAPVAAPLAAPLAAPIVAPLAAPLHSTTIVGPAFATQYQSVVSHTGPARLAAPFHY
jgi:hypothetical protein